MSFECFTINVLKTSKDSETVHSWPEKNDITEKFQIFFIKVKTSCVVTEYEYIVNLEVLSRNKFVIFCTCA